MRRTHGTERRGTYYLVEPIYDVFLSFSGADRDEGRELALELRTLGFSVFLDEDGIEPFAGITEGIDRALKAAKTLVAYYSAEYANRPACQRELMTAFLAGQREGDPGRRIMVINPEPGTDHLRPVELANAKFARPPAEVAELARQVGKRVAELDRPIGGATEVVRRGWSATRASQVRSFLGRYRELWDLHTALHAMDYPFIHENACGSFATVCGMPGAGKTSLVASYAWLFAAAFPGGTHWVSLAGPDAAEDVLRKRYASELRRIAPELGVDPETVTEDRPADSIARKLRDTGAASLWLVDDIPAGIRPCLLDFLTMPADTGARTVLVSDEDVFRDLVPVIRAGPLPDSDASALLDRYRSCENEADRGAREDIVCILNGNAAALVAVGEYLRDLQGLSSYVSVAAELASAGTIAETPPGRLRRLVDRMSEVELALLRLVDQTGEAAFPARLLAALPSLAGVDVGKALKRLLARSAAVRTEAVWRLDPLAARAARGRYHAAGPEIPLSEVNETITRVSELPDLTTRERQALQALSVTEPPWIKSIQTKVDFRAGGSRKTA